MLQGVTEEFSYDKHSRLTQSTRTATIAGGFPNYVQSVTYMYNELGNLLQKSDYANKIDYDLTNKPHQAHKAWADSAKTQLLTEYVYDANGNLISSTGQATQARSIGYNYQMLPTSISRGAASSLFAYDENNERYFEKHISNGKTEKIYKLGKSFELRFTTESGVTTEEEQHYLGSNAQLMYKKAQNGKAECYFWRYLLLDRLGSVETVTNQSGQVLERHGFDPFGKARAGNWVVDSTRDGSSATEKGLFSRISTRGFTGHDHIDSVGLIHMNGRAYDPELGRFLGVDPFMTSPLNAQTMNPYSYVSNNPIMGTDPTGYCEAQVGTHIKNCAKFEVKAENTKTGETSTKKIDVNLDSAKDVASKWSGAVAGAVADVKSNGAQSSVSKTDVSKPTTDVQAKTDTKAGDQVNAETQSAKTTASGSARGHRPGIDSESVPLVDSDGKRVIGGNGKPVVLPKGKGEEFIREIMNAGADVAGADASIISIRVFEDLKKFKQGGPWDLQRLSGKFDKRYIDAATVVIGIYGAAAGLDFDELMSIQNTYAAAFSRYAEGTKMSGSYPSLPERNVQNTQIGYAWYKDHWDAFKRSVNNSN